MSCSWQTIARWERGKQKPSNLAIATLRRVLLVPEVAATLTEELRRWSADGQNGAAQALNGTAAAE